HNAPALPRWRAAGAWPLSSSAAGRARRSWTAARLISVEARPGTAASEARYRRSASAKSPACWRPSAAKKCALACSKRSSTSAADLGERRSVEGEQLAPGALGIRCAVDRRAGLGRHVGDAPAVARRVDLDLDRHVAGGEGSAQLVLCFRLPLVIGGRAPDV